MTETPGRPILAINSAAPDRWVDRLVVFDLETTGVDPSNARIVTAYVGVLGASGSVLEGQLWLADPGVDIPEASTRIHGITNERARAEGRPAAEVVQEIRDLLASHLAQGLAVCAFNAAYDVSLLAAECERHGVPQIDARPIIDPLVLDKQLNRYRKGKRTLGVVAGHYGVELVDAHDASGDAIAAGHLAQALAAQHVELRIDPISLHDLTVGWADEQAAEFEQFRRRTDPSFSADRGWPVRR